MTEMLTRMDGRRWLPLLILSVSLAPTALRGQTAPREPWGYCAVNRIDGPTAPGGYAAATGFAVDLVQGAPVEKIELTLDGKPAGEANLRGLRPDVMAHFARQDYLWSGWSGTVSLENVPAGKHAVGAVAVLESGERVPCEGPSEVVALPLEDDPDPSPLAIGALILLRTFGFLFGLALMGWAAAAYLRLRPLPLTAPLIGLCLFAVFVQWAAAVKIRPFHAAVVLVLLAIAALVLLFRADRERLRPNFREARASLIAVAAFAAIGVIPLSAHGPGAVLGDIDDAVRESSLADSIARFGWNVPPDVRGYLAVIPTAWRSISAREGGAYLLSALAQRFGLPAHEVHSVAILGVGCLVILAAGFLARQVLPDPRLVWIAPALVALNSVIIVTLYGQHLGSLLAAALMPAFVAFLLRLTRARGLEALLPAALAAAAALTLYPETLAAWAVAGAILPMTAERGARVAVLRKLALAAVLAVGLNPVGFVRAGRFAIYNATHSKEMVSPYTRLIAGDTHYFPPLTVVAGIEAYRDDARAPVGALRAFLIPVAALMILVTSVVGFRRLPRRSRWVLLLLLGPPFLALYATERIGFPYGFAKFLPLTVPLWAAAFALLLWGATRAAPEERAAPAASRLLAWGTVALTLLLALPAVRHVVSRAARAVPAYDPAFRVLPAVARALGRNAVFRVDEPLVARRQWMVYFLGENAVEYETATGLHSRPDAPGPRFRLVDRRDPDSALPAPAAAQTRYFAAARIPDGKP